MAVVTKKCYYSNSPKFILFYFHSRSLAKLKEYEKQVEAIPVLQVKLSVLKEEKRLLMLQLKQREFQLRKETSRGLDDSDGPLGMSITVVRG